MADQNNIEKRAKQIYEETLAKLRKIAAEAKQYYDKEVTDLENVIRITSPYHNMGAGFNRDLREANMRDIRANVQNRQNQYKSAFESFAARVTSMSRDVNDVEIMVRIVEMVPGLKDSARQMDKLANNQTLVNLIDAKLKGWQKTISSDEGFQSRLRNAQKRTANENLRQDQIKLQKAEDELARAEKKLKTLQEGYAEELKKSAETVRVRMEEQAQALTGTDQALFAAEDQALSALRQTAVGGKSVRKMIADVFEGETIRGAEEQLRAAETECLQARKKWLENVREPDQRMAKMKEDRDRKKSKIEEIQAAIRAGRAVLQELEG